jgi:hypothetical protein
MFLRLMEEPHCTKFNTDMCAAAWILPIALKDEPILTKFLNENDDPKLAASKIDKEDPSRVNP